MTAATHNAPEFKHPDEMDWEMGRFRNVTKFLFHPTPERPTTPNVGFLRYEPGAGLSHAQTRLRADLVRDRRRVPHGREDVWTGHRRLHGRPAFSRTR